MTWPLWEAFGKEWDRRPPVHWLVSWFVGYKPPAETDRRSSGNGAAIHPEQQYMTPEAAKDWLARTGGVIEGVRKL